MMIAVMLLLMHTIMVVMVLRRVRNNASLAVVHLRGEHWRVHLMLLRVRGRGWIDKYWRHQVVIGCRNC